MKPFFFSKVWMISMATAAVLSACGGTSDAPEAAFNLQLLHISDADGSDSTALNSVANLSGMIQKFRAQYPQQTLTVSSGDNYIPGPRFNAANDSSLNAALGVAEQMLPQLQAVLPPAAYGVLGILVMLARVILQPKLSK